ncbi:MAG: FAD binding domain-containing protein, partial [Spirochaetales bacterium]
LPSHTLYLQNVKELQRFGRNEDRIDIGACVSLQGILRYGPKILTPFVASALSKICPPSVMSLATLGGNLSVADRCMAAFPLLHVLDARCEVRSYRKTRWIPVTGLRNTDGTFNLSPKEIITRIQIPLEEWDISIYRRLGEIPFGIHSDSLVLVVVAKLHRQMLSEFRFAFGKFTPLLYRNRDIETLLIGSRIPLETKDLEAFLKVLDTDLRTHPIRLSPTQIAYIFRILSIIFGELSPDTE